MTMHNNNNWLEAIYRETFPLVAGFIKRAGGDADTAKDIFHDALLIYMEKEQQQTLNIRTTPRTYIMGIAKILWIKKVKDGHNTISLTGIEEQLTIPDDFNTAAESRMASLAGSLQLAGTRCIELLQAFYYRRWSMQHIAQIFHYKTTHSATVQKYKCLEKVREQIKLSVYEDVAA
ncbi:MAG: sigma-70 family RNA polymerase sigma factor [Chitinophagaceae bacterium]